MFKWGTSQECELGSVLEKLVSILDQKRKIYMVILTGAQNALLNKIHPVTY